MIRSMEKSSDYTEDHEDSRAHGERIANFDEHTKKTMSDSLTKGSSFSSQRVDSLSTLMTHHNYSIVVGIQISNVTKYDLKSPSSTAIYGFNPKAATSIPSGVTEVMIARKRGYTLSGTNGVVSWQIDCTKRRVFVIWDCPYFSSNKMAVGFTVEGTEEFDDEWYNTVMSSKQHEKLVYQMSHYNKKCKELLVEDKEKKFLVSSVMGSGSKPQINVTFKPVYEKDIASNLRKHLT